MTDKERKLAKKRARADRQRNLRVVEYLDYSNLLSDCPVEITEGYVVSDVEEAAVFASFVFRNVSGKQIGSFDVRLLCYNNQNIPYLKIPFEYCYDSYTFGERRMRGYKVKDKKALRMPIVEPNETFGEGVYIPLPESYFTKLEIELMSITYADGSTQTIKTVAGRSRDRLGFEDRGFAAAYQTINIYLEAEAAHPAIVIPQASANAWLCCCGHKNSISDDKCEICFRDKEWQLCNLNNDNLQKVKLESCSSGANIDHDKYKQNRFMESDAEIAQKIKQYETAMKNIAAEEQARESRRKWLIPKILLCMAAVYLIGWVIAYIATLLNV